MYNHFLGFFYLLRRILVSVPSQDAWPGLPSWLLHGISYVVLCLFPISFTIEKATKSIFCKSSTPLKHTKYMFVANHNVWGQDALFTYIVIYLTTGLYPRGLADRGHFYFPGWAQFFWFVGAIDASPESCRGLMERNEPILVYPGGANEVFRIKGEPKYQLKWGKRAGFAKLATEYDYTIIPISVVGVDDMLHVIWNVPFDWFWRLTGDSRVGRHYKPPIIVPTGTYERIYAHIGSPISANYVRKDEATSNHLFHRKHHVSTSVASDRDELDVILDLRDKTFEASQLGIRKCVARQAHDSDRYVLRCWYRSLFRHNDPHRKRPFGLHEVVV